MPKKITQEEFIAFAERACGDKFDFTHSLYKDSNKPVTAICPIHGEITRRADSFLKGRSCRLCANDKQRCTLKEFIDKAQKVHGNKYDYSRVKYINNDIKVEVLCPVHGSFYVAPSDHLKGNNCPYCSTNHIPTTEEFVTEIKKVLGNKYDYSKVVYTSARYKVCLICPKHGEVFVYSYQARRGTGCKKCSYENLSLTTNVFIARAKKRHGDLYDYSNTTYINANTDVEIICKKHGAFFIKPNHHLYGQGCPRCFCSKGEKAIAEWLMEHKIGYVQHYKITPLQYSLFGRLYFVVDFLLPTLHTIIEYNGKQHYKRIEAWHTEEEFQEQQDRDRRLRKHCRQNGIKLIEISYTKFNEIDKVLDKKNKAA